MKTSTDRQRRVLAWSLHLAGMLVTALAVGGFYGLVYQPLEQRQNESAVRVEQLDRLLMRPGSEGTEYRQLRTQLNEMKAQIAEVNRQFSASINEEQVVEELSNIAASVDLQVMDYQMGNTESLPTHSETEVEFRCHGSYASICKFLEEAEHFAKTTKLSKFELDARQNSAWYPIQLTFVLYSDAPSHDTKEKRGVL